MKRLVAVGMMACAVTTLAMPTKVELTKAQPIVNELMKPLVDDFKAKRKSAKEVAESAESFAKEAETEAAKLLLLRGAISYYSRSADYEKAADAVALLQSEVKNIPPETVAEIISRATSRISAKNAPRLYSQYRLAKALVKAKKDMPRLEAALKKRPLNFAARREYAELLALTGDWKGALAQFAELKGKEASMAKAELAGKAKSGELGDFWWDYKAQSEDVADAIKAQAVAYYRAGLAANEITGLKKALAEQRIEEAGSSATAEPRDAEGKSGSNDDSAFKIKGNEATLDLGEKYGKLEFVKCPAGMVKVVMNKKGETRKIRISRDFWITKTPTTGLQNSVAPLLGEYGHLSRDMTDGLTSFLSSHFEDDLPKGMVVRLPTTAEWEYAYHANTKDKKEVFYDLANKGEKQWREEIKHSKEDVKDKTHVNIEKTCANRWGLCNFGTWERVLDKFPREVFEKQGWDSVKNDRKQKGGWFHAHAFPLPENHVDTFSWSDDKDALIVSRSARWTGWFVDKHTDNDWGPVFRLVIGPDLVSEWRAKNKKK